MSSIRTRQQLFATELQHEGNDKKMVAYARETMDEMSRIRFELRAIRRFLIQRFTPK